MVRIIRPHHPLYLKLVPLVDFWGTGGRGLVIELPDGSHTRVPRSWLDDGNGPVPATVDRQGTKLSVIAARDLIAALQRASRRRKR